jgi:hypothetical protein
VALIGVVSAGFLNATAPAQARGKSDVHVVPIDPLAFDDPGAVMKLYAPPPSKSRLAADPTADANCGDAAPDPIPDYAPIDVLIHPATTPFTVGKITAAMWKSPPLNEATWKLNFWGLTWIKPLARRAAIDGRQDALDVLMAQAVAFHHDNPDPGTTDYGWDEAAATLRLETENCLYALSPATALAAVMTQDAAVVLGPRYYGPPIFAVHNHGLMANLQLVRAADELNKPSWKQTAVTRMAAEAPLAFSAQGIAYEQSSGYQILNADLWQRAAAVLEGATGYESAASTIRTTVDKARTAYSWMTEPDDHIVQIGDSDQAAGVPADLGSARVLRDDQTGWIIGRWSWTDPNASYYTVRYGPGRRGHGQFDNSGGVTWSTKGVRVLVGPGRFSYDSTSNYNRYQTSPNSHNVAIPDGGVVRPVGATLVSSLVQAPAHAWNVTDQGFGITHTRNVNINRDVPQMRVNDKFPTATLWRQSWHLDPQWTLSAGGPNSTQLTFIHPSGRILTITTTGRVSSIQEGITRPPQGWHFPAFGQRVWAPEIVIRSYGKACDTTFAIR